MNGVLESLLCERRLIVLVGEGGVGKTSTAAALAVAAAGLGRRVGVLTVDPAPRLGDALGLVRIESTPTPVELGEQADGGGSLHAMRLDTKRTFDRMVERFAPSAETAKQLLDNPIYEAVSGSLGGSEQYMAFQVLHEFAENDDYDLIIIDTPPAEHATDLLAAPARLGDLLDSGAASILAEPTRILARAGSTVARVSFGLLLAVLKGLTGNALQSQLSEFVTLVDSLLADLHDRSAEIADLLRDEATAFVLVVRPRPGDVKQADSFARGLASDGIDIRVVVVNRLTPARAADRTQISATHLREAPPGSEEAIATMEREIDALRRLEVEALDHARGGFARGTSPPAVLAIDALAWDIATLDDIHRLAAKLLRA